MLEIEELEVIIEEAQEKLKNNIFLANRKDELEEYLISINMEEIIIALKQVTVLSKDNSKIAVIGASDISRHDIYSIFKEFAISENMLELCTDYDKLKTYSIEALKDKSVYRAVLVGAIPHSTSATSHYSSMIARLEQEEGFPKVFRLQAGGKLKITNNSLKNAIQKFKFSFKKKLITKFKFL